MIVHISGLRIVAKVMLFYTVNSTKTCLKRPLKKKTKIGFQDRFSLNAGQKYCRMLSLEHSAILSTFIKLPFVNKIFILSIFEWPFKTGYTVLYKFSEDWFKIDHVGGVSMNDDEDSVLDAPMVNSTDKVSDASFRIGLKST